MSETQGDPGGDSDRISQLVAAHVDSMEVVCALAAALSDSRELCPPTVERALRGVLASLGLAELAAAPITVDSAALSTVLRGRIIEGCELVENPVRTPGWTPTSTDVIEGQP